MKGQTMLKELAISDLGAGLDPALEAPWLVPPGDDPAFGENDALWVWDDERRIGIHVHLRTLPGRLYHLRRENINVFLPDGTVLMRLQDGPGTTSRAAAGPNLVCQCEEPYRRWSFDFDCMAQPATVDELRAGPLRDGPLAPVAFDVDATMTVPAWRQGAFFDTGTEATNFYGGFRIEQLLRGEGTVRLGAETIRIAGPGLRTHRRGGRNLVDYPGHTWMTAVFPSGRAFYVMRFAGADGVAVNEEAWVQQDGKFYQARALRSPLCTGAGPGEPLVLELESALGRTLIRGEVIATNFQTLVTNPYSNQRRGADRSRDGNLVMTQGFARYQWNDEVACNMIERSLPHADVKD
jgi:hypothetical protein